MRYDKQLTLIYEFGYEYNPDTSREEFAITKQSEPIPCHLSPITIQRSVEVFGGYNKDIFVANLKNQQDVSAEFVVLDNQWYKIVTSKSYRQRTTLYLEEGKP